MTSAASSSSSAWKTTIPNGAVVTAAGVREPSVSMEAKHELPVEIDHRAFLLGGGGHEGGVERRSQHYANSLMPAASAPPAPVSAFAVRHRSGR